MNDRIKRTNDELKADRPTLDEVKVRDNDKQSAEMEDLISS